RLYDRQVRRLRALENATGICADLTKRIRQAASVAHQPAGYDIVTHRICRGDCVARRQVDQLRRLTKNGSGPTKSASGRSRTKLAKAALISPLVPALRTWICSPIAQPLPRLSASSRERDRPD